MKTNRVILLVPKEKSLQNNNSREETVKNDIEAMKTFKWNIVNMKQFHENIGVESIAAYLKERKIETIVYHNTYEEIDYKEIIESEPIMIGISILYNLHLEGMVEIVKNLRENLYKGIILLGGPFASLASRNILRLFPDVDCVCYGEGEKVIYELVKRLEKKDDWKKTPGIVVRDQEKYKYIPVKSIEKIDELPRIDRPVLEKLKMKGFPISVAAVYSSRGCAGKCKYCSAPNLNKFYKKKWRPKSASNIVEEMEILNQKYGINYFYFCDDNFFGYGSKGKKRLNDIATLILKKGLKVKFHAEVRADSNIPDELLWKLKEAGLKDVLLGIESGAQTVLNRWRKGTTVEENKKAITRLKKMGFNVEASMILIDADMSKIEFQKTVQFIKNTEIYLTKYPLNLFNKLIVFEGTEIYEEYKNRKLLKDKKCDIDIPAEDKIWYLYEKEYSIVDEDMAYMWDRLMLKVYELRYYTNEILPQKIIEIFNGRPLDKHELTKLKKWRKSLGLLCMDLLDTCCTWLEKSDINNLDEMLNQCIELYNQNFMEI